MKPSAWLVRIVGLAGLVVFVAGVIGAGVVLALTLFIPSNLPTVLAFAGRALAVGLIGGAVFLLWRVESHLRHVRAE